MMTACDFSPKSASGYPRPCTEEDVSASVRDKYFSQVENFLTNFYMLLLEVCDKDMTEDFVANLFHDTSKKNFLSEFTKSGTKSEYFSPYQYVMEYHKALQPFNRDELTFTVSNFSHQDDMYMLSMRSCYTVSDYDLTLHDGQTVIYKSRCRAVCVFPKASSYLTVKLMQVEPVSNMVSFNKSAVYAPPPAVVEPADTNQTVPDTLTVDNTVVVVDTVAIENVDTLKVAHGNKINQEITAPIHSVNGHDYVDLGLSVKWATCNIGASSPEEAGYYFAWGETTPKDKYIKSNCRFFNIDIGNISKSPRYDAAQAVWGKDWRMPTEKELVELKNKCKWQQQEVNGVVGFRITGPNGNSIFLPAAGNKASKVTEMNRSGYYWSGDSYYVGKNSGYNCEYGAVSLNFTVEGYKATGWGRRDMGKTIRAVSDWFDMKR